VRTAIAPQTPISLHTFSAECVETLLSIQRLTLNICHTHTASFKIEIARIKLLARLFDLMEDDRQLPYSR
jgi:hypothetical protein